MSFISFSMYFRSLYIFLKKLNQKNKNENGNSAWADFRPKATACWPSDPRQLARRARTMGGHRSHSPRGGALTVPLDLQDELEGGSGVAPGKVERAAAHRAMGRW
jgi:hypothetical protein